MAPSVVSQLRHFPGARLMARMELSFSCGSLVVVIIVVQFREVTGAEIELVLRRIAVRNGTRGAIGLWQLRLRCTYTGAFRFVFSFGEWREFRRLAFGNED